MLSVSWVCFVFFSAVGTLMLLISVKQELKLADSHCPSLSCSCLSSEPSCVFLLCYTAFMFPGLSGSTVFISCVDGGDTHVFLSPGVCFPWSEVLSKQCPLCLLSFLPFFLPSFELYTFRES